MTVTAKGACSTSPTLSWTADPSIATSYTLKVYDKSGNYVMTLPSKLTGSVAWPKGTGSYADLPSNLNTLTVKLSATGFETATANANYADECVATAQTDLPTTGQDLGLQALLLLTMVTVGGVLVAATRKPAGA
jgi:hypothetical protein